MLEVNEKNHWRTTREEASCPSLTLSLSRRGILGNGCIGSKCFYYLLWVKRTLGEKLAL